MGFWDAVKEVAIAAKCGIGFHAGEYQQKEGKPACFWFKICPDCGKYVVKHEHDFDQWEYRSYGTCNAVRECIHCRKEEYSIVHNYEKVEKDANCHVISVCSRCGDRVIGGAEHNWVKNPFTGEALLIDGGRRCKDCGFFDKKS